MPDTLKPKIKITADRMSATLSVPAPEEAGRTWQEEELLLYLDVFGVEYGIDNDAVKQALEEDSYGREIVIATGKRPTEGIEGRYDFQFSQEFSHVPSLRPDGTADYRSIKTMELVEEEQVIAIYSPAVQGEDGMDVTGAVVPAKRVRELSPLRGRGFSRSSDGLTYTSSCAGKIIREKDGRIMIYPVHEVFGDAGIDGGNIEFRGDVVVHGDVSEGITIRATGSIVIDGVAADCTLSAGDDIIIKQGVKGAERTTIRAGKRIMSEFIELANVSCDGMLEADVFYNSEIFVGERIVLTGKKASVVGGTMRAVEGIECQNVGNEFGVNTVVQVGMDAESVMRIRTLTEEIEKLNEDLVKVEMGLKDYDDMEEKTGRSYKGDPKRMQLLRSKLHMAAGIDRRKTELSSLMDRYERAKEAEIVIHGYVCPGTRLYLSELQYPVLTSLKSVKYKKVHGEVVAIGLDE